jgi:hypothetical protein
VHIIVTSIAKVNSSQRLGPNEQQPHPRPHDHPFERPIFRRDPGPTHHISLTSRGHRRFPCWLASYPALSAASVAIERGSLCAENTSSAVQGGSAAWSIVRCSFRFITTLYRTLLLSSGGGGWTPELSVFVSASPTKVWFSAFSAPMRLSALGVIPVMVRLVNRRR